MNAPVLPAQSRRPARRLEGKVAIVTGAGSVGDGFGTGKATAILFAAEGARVVLMDNNAEQVAQTRRLIDDAGGECTTAVGDITVEADCRAAVEQAVAQYGALHVLDNNVGMSMRGTVVDLSVEQWDRVLSVNLRGMALVSKYAVPAMAAAGGGSIINISSVGAIRPNETTPLTAYSASKGGVESLTRAMAVDHGRQGIRVNCIEPGPLFTPRQVAGGLSDETRAARRQLSLLGREGLAWDIGWAAVFLASDEAAYVTGAILPVDGGVTVRGHSYR